MLMKLKNISVEEILRPQMYNNLHANVQRRSSFEPRPWRISKVSLKRQRKGGG